MTEETFTPEEITTPKFAEGQVVAYEGAARTVATKWPIPSDWSRDKCRPLTAEEAGPHLVPRAEFDKLWQRSITSADEIESLERLVRDLKKRNAELETETKAQKDYLDTLYEPYDEADQ